ncbi:tyrosine phosphatase, partial [Paramuricea clavata]
YSTPYKICTKRMIENMIQEFTKREIEYKKIKCEGKIVPPEKVVHKFKATLLTFFKKFPNSASVVGVHCTHGLNRAGYIVCRYLIECRGHSPQEAIEVFNKARGHKMERENYLEDLQQRKPKTLSEQDIEHLIETSPPSDDEYQPDGYRKRDYRGGYQQRRDTHAPFRPEIPEPRGPTGGKRRYRERFNDRDVEHQDCWSYDEVNYDDDRFYGRRFAGDTGRYQNSERGNLKYERDSYTDQDKFPSHDERHREERRHEVDRRRRLH